MGKKVLIIDDDPDVRSYIITVLEENDYTPLIARNGEEGLKLIRQEGPDLILLDVLMPRGSGVKLFREVKTAASLKHIPVIVLSGIAEKSFLRSQKALAEFGGTKVPEPDAYMEKPVEPEELAAMIKKVIG